MSDREVSRLGQKLYDDRIRSVVENSNRGKFLVLDVSTGDYEIDADDLTASERLLERHPQGILFGVRIGYPAAYDLGSSGPAG
jgi:hypothetical protein